MATTDELNKTTFSLRVEQYGPTVCSLLTIAALIYFSDWVSEKFSTDNWKSVGLYSAIFGWSAIQTGFAFGVYGFVVGKGDGFIAALRNTKAMARFMDYIKRTNITGFLLTITSIPLIITEPKVTESLSFSYVVVSLWFALFIWSFLSFLRLAYNFGQIASIKDKVTHGA
ncbi:MAG: hypothetical protein JKY55_04995 [Aliivibrio sp.]|uniref:hypothetical protein n=1 Tax=Aliivibrio sp. TaxID=1872443 RepID=UPI001A4CC5B9|nr:hypothetical protein [Aliivibrio sp.]